MYEPNEPNEPNEPKILEMVRPDSKAEIIGLLEEALARAREGRTQSIAIMEVYTVGASSTAFFLGDCDIRDLIVPVLRLKLRLLGFESDGPL